MLSASGSLRTSARRAEVELAPVPRGPRADPPLPRPRRPRPGRGVHRRRRRDRRPGRVRHYLRGRPRRPPGLPRVGPPPPAVARRPRLPRPRTPHLQGRRPLRVPDRTTHLPGRPDRRRPRPVRHRRPGQRAAARRPPAAGTEVRLPREPVAQGARPAVRLAEARRAHPGGTGSTSGVAPGGPGRGRGAVEARSRERLRNPSSKDTGPGGGAIGRAGRPEAVCPGLGAGRRDRPPRPQAPPREGECAARRRTGRRQDDPPGRGRPGGREAVGGGGQGRGEANVHAPAVLADDGRPADRRDEVPRPVGGARRGGHRRARRSRKACCASSDCSTWSGPAGSDRSDSIAAFLVPVPQPRRTAPGRRGDARANWTPAAGCCRGWPTCSRSSPSSRSTGRRPWPCWTDRSRRRKRTGRWPWPRG